MLIMPRRRVLIQEVGGGGGGDLTLLGAASNGNVWGTNTQVTIAAIGDTAGDRIIGIAWGSNTAPVLVGLQVGGVAATLLGQNSSGYQGVAFFRVAVAQGNTGVVALTTSGTDNSRLSAWAWDLNGNTPGTPVGDDGGADPDSFTLNLTNGAGAKVLAISAAFGDDATYTGVTKHTGAGEEFTNFDGGYYHSAALNNSASANQSVGIVFTGSPYATMLAMPLE